MPTASHIPFPILTSRAEHLSTTTTLKPSIGKGALPSSSGKAVFPSFFAQFLCLIEYLLRNHCLIDPCRKIHGSLSPVTLHFTR